MPLLLDHLHGIGNIFLGQAGKAQTHGLKMHRQEQAHIVQQCRHNSRQHNLRIANAQKLRHNKAHGTHNRRTELTARRSNCLYCPGKFFAIAGLLH